MSWVVVSRSTGKAKFETFDAKRAAYYSSQNKYEVLTAQEWLARVNKQIAEHRIDDQNNTRSEA